VATVGELLRAAVERLRAADSPSPRLDAELLLGDAVGVGRTGVIAHPDSPVGPDAAATFARSIERRELGEPVAYIRGLKEFRSLALHVDDRALIPRPETELLVELAEREVISRLTSSPRPPGTPALRVADIGTGSGAIAVALVAALRRRRMADEVMVIATDISEAALDVARVNAVSHGVADRMLFFAADLVPPHVDPPYAVVCANLPYIRTADLEQLPREVRFEPELALDGGPDGLDLIRRLFDALRIILRPDGVALLEIGSDQQDAVRDAVREALPNWRCEVIPDLAGWPRVARVVPPGTHAA
jgi:release factor glutamine methyltransferase